MTDTPFAFYVDARTCRINALTAGGAHKSGTSVNKPETHALLCQQTHELGPLSYIRNTQPHNGLTHILCRYRTVGKASHN